MGDLPRHAARAAILGIFLLASRPASASCGPVSCTVQPVDASCQPLTTQTAVSGDPLRLSVACTVQCCAGASTCGSSPYAVEASKIVLHPYVSGSPSSETTGVFTAHATCQDVFVSNGCVESGHYGVSVDSPAFINAEIDVSTDSCDSNAEGACAATRRRDGPKGPYAIVLALLIGSRWRRRKRSARATS